MSKTEREGKQPSPKKDSSPNRQEQKPNDPNPDTDLTEQITSLFPDLFNRLTGPDGEYAYARFGMTLERLLKQQRFVILFVGGAPGSGKSTLIHQQVEYLKKRYQDLKIRTIRFDDNLRDELAQQAGGQVRLKTPDNLNTSQATILVAQRMAKVIQQHMKSLGQSIMEQCPTENEMAMYPDMHLLIVEIPIIGRGEPLIGTLLNRVQLPKGLQRLARAHSPTKEEMTLRDCLLAIVLEGDKKVKDAAMNMRAAISAATTAEEIIAALENHNANVSEETREKIRRLTQDEIDVFKKVYGSMATPEQIQKMQQELYEILDAFREDQLMQLVRLTAAFSSDNTDQLSHLTDEQIIDELSPKAEETLRGLLDTTISHAVLATVENENYRNVFLKSVASYVISLGFPASQVFVAINEYVETDLKIDV